MFAKKYTIILKPAGAGVLGAIGAKYGGAAGSFIGTGGGAVLGALTSRALA